MLESRNINLQELGKYVKVICPICHKEKKIIIPKVIINHIDNLATISVPMGHICDHHFQIYIDKNYKIRGYQKVDYQCSEDLEGTALLPKNSDVDLFDNLILDGNHLEYRPKKRPLLKKSKKIPPFKDAPQEIKVPNAILTLPRRIKKQEKIPAPQDREEYQEKCKEWTNAEIYEEFWEFITDNNDNFREFIESDKERRSRSKLLSFFNSLTSNFH